MTINELQLPLNFELEDLYVISNNNAAFLLENGKRFGASSIILGFHSPVIKEKYVKQGILEIDADDFSYDTVKTVVEAMYCGQLRITRENFREVNKMCHVFQVTWMSTKCLEFFVGAFEDPQDSESNIKDLFDEAVYFCQHGKSASLLEIWKDKTGEENHCDMLRGYLEPESYYSDFVLRTLIDLTADHFVLLDHIRDRTSKTNHNLDNVSRYLLNNIDLVGCFERHATRSTEIFDLLLDDEDSADWRMLYKLYRTVSKECLIRQSKETAVCSNSADPDKTIPNLFHSSVRTGTIEEIIERAGAVSCNIYMVIESIIEYRATPNIIRIIQTLIREKGWSPAHYNFLDTYGYNFDVDLLRNCAAITAEVNSPNCVRVAAEGVTNDFRCTTTSAIYRFYMQLPGAPTCDMKSKCGFLIEVTGVSREAPGAEQFDIKLILDNNKYPADMHCHGISADRIHLVLERHSKRDNRWFNMAISWRGKPQYLNGEVSWGGWTRWICTAAQNQPVSLVAYYTI